MGWLAWLNDIRVMALVGWLGGFAFGYLVGRTAKTRPYEIERDNARRDLDTLREAIEIAKK